MKKRWRVVMALVAVTSVALTSQAPMTRLCDEGRAQSLCQASHKAMDWSQWLVGRSASAQFHFIDLLELLTPSRERP